MALYVRVRDPAVLRRHVEEFGTQSDVAARSDLSVQRLSQLVTGVAPVIRAAFAAKIEEVLGVEPGTLFVVDQGHLLRPYLDDTHDTHDGGHADGPPADQN